MQRRWYNVVAVALMLAGQPVWAQAQAPAAFSARVTVSAASAQQVKALCDQAGAEGAVVRVVSTGPTAVLEITAPTQGVLANALARLHKAARGAGLEAQLITGQAPSLDAVVAGGGVKAQVTVSPAPAALQAGSPAAAQARVSVATARPARADLPVEPLIDSAPVRGPPA
jgi:hypothetical protein